MLKKFKNMKHVFDILLQPILNPKIPEHEYTVYRREVWVQPVKITATSEAEALDKVAGGEGEYLEDGMEYSHTLDDHEYAVVQLETLDKVGQMHEEVQRGVMAYAEKKAEKEAKINSTEDMNSANKMNYEKWTN